MTLDEFALWLYLRDVYWCPEGRSSIDATIIGIILAILLPVGSSPFGLEDGRMPSAIFFGVVAFNLLVAIMTFLKGKLVLGTISVFVPVVGVVGAVRHAKPSSLWAKHVYRAHSPERLARAQARFEDVRSRYPRLHNWLDDLVGGAPTSTYMSMLDVVGGRLAVSMERPDEADLPPPRLQPSGR